MPATPTGQQRKTLVDRYRDTYSGLPRAAWILAGVQLVNMSGTMVIFFLALYLTRRLDFPEARAGLAMSGYGVGMLAGALAGGTLSDRLGAFRVQRLGLAASALVLALIPFLHSLAWIFLGIVAWGFFTCSLWPANAAAMSALCPEAVRAKGFVLNRLANNLGATVGPVVGGLLAQHDYRLLFWVDGATCLLAAIALLWAFPMDRVPAEPREAETSQTLRSSWLSDRIFLWLLVASVAIGMIFSQIFSTFGPYLRSYQDFTEPQIGRLFAVNTILVVGFQMPLTHFAGRFPGPRTAAAGSLAFALGFGLMPAGEGFAFLALTVATWTVGEMLVMPTITTLVSLRAPAHLTGRYMGLHSLGFSLGIILGPAMGMRLLQISSGAALWRAVGALGVALSFLFLALAHAWAGEQKAVAVE
jgi:MFS family permease